MSLKFYDPELPDMTDLDWMESDLHYEIELAEQRLSKLKMGGMPHTYAKGFSDALKFVLRELESEKRRIFTREGDNCEHEMRGRLRGRWVVRYAG